MLLIVETKETVEMKKNDFPRVLIEEISQGVQLLIDFRTEETMNKAQFLTRRFIADSEVKISDSIEKLIFE